MEGKKLIQEFGASVEVLSFREPSDLERLINDVEEIAKKTYQRGLGVGFVADEEMRCRLHIDAQKGRLRAFLLYLSGKPCAFWLGTLYQKTFHGGYVGFDPDYRRFSPGTFLTRRVIDRLCDHNVADVIEEIDFGLGDAQYKRALSNRSWQEAIVYIFGSGLRGLTLNVLQTPIALIDQLTKRALEKAGNLQQIKKTWRERVRRRITVAR